MANRFTSCGCSKTIKMFASQRGIPCCNQSVQAPPSPCCEPHISIQKPGVCFRPTCSVAATDEHFYIAFSNLCDEEVPIDLGTVFFYSQSAGFLNIHLYNGTSYEVSLVDLTKVGAVIEQDSCVLVVPTMEAGSSVTNRCLSGNFVAPALNATATIYILNGSSIPIGSTLTFTAEGETGSYLVTAYLTASGNVYAYTVENTGAGLTPGTLVEAGPAGTCTYPIEIITDVDICDLSEAEEVDSLTGCLNGSPRAMVPTGEDYVPRGTAEGTWSQAKFTNFDCCVFTEGCVKFSGNGCTEAMDTFTVADGVGIECLTEAWDNAQEHATVVTATISSSEISVSIIILDWDADTRTMTARPANEDYLPEGETFVEFCDPGTPICLGDCCRQCTNGPQTTDIYVDDQMEGDSTFIIGPATLAYDDATPTEYLIGYNQAGALTVLTIDSTFNDDLTPPTGRPIISDPLVIRQKMCNTHPYGCTQDANIEFNYDIRFGGLAIPSELIINWQLGSFCYSSQTLADDVTPNPYFNTASQAKAAGQVVGISTTQSNLAGTIVGFAGPSETKTFPIIEGFFKDHMQLPDCNCGLNIVWFYVLLTPQATIAPGNIEVTLAIRRYIEKKVVNQIPIPDNDPTAQGFN